MGIRSFALSLVVLGLWAGTAEAINFTIFGDDNTRINGISDYGGVMVGARIDPDVFSGPLGNELRHGSFARRWTSPTSVLEISSGYATGVSADGSTVVGTLNTHASIIGPNTQPEAFRWRSGSGTGTGSVKLGRPPGTNSESYAHAVSPDGKTVVGIHRTVVFDPTTFGVVIKDSGRQWPGGRLFDPPTGGWSEFTAISGNGVVAGSVAGPASGYQPFVFRNGLAQGFNYTLNFEGRTSDISRDGKVVVGNGGTPQGYLQAFRWKDSTGTYDDGVQGGVTHLGSLPGSLMSSAFATNADGSVIVGQTIDTGEGFYWSESTGMQSADSLLLGYGADLNGFHVARVTGVSANGLSIVGEGYLGGASPGSPSRAFVAHLPQIVGLAWGEDVPASFNVLEDKTGKTTTVTKAGTTAASAVDAATRADLKQRVEEIFAESGLINVLFVDGEVPGGTNVYFADPIPDSDLLGEALSGVDQFNQSAKGEIAVFLTGGNELDATIIAHEVGHTLGLRHIRPGDDLNPNQVMDYSFPAGSPERFLNGSEIVYEPPEDGGKGHTVEPPFGVLTHNTLYHLKRYVEGYSDAELVAAGIVGGRWDLKPNGGLPAPARMVASLNFGAFDLELFDVHLLVGEIGGEGAMEELAYSPSLLLSQLGTLAWDLESGQEFVLLASSTPGGPLDVILSTGNPFDDDDYGVTLGVGDTPIFLQLITDPLSDSYITLAGGLLIGVGEAELVAEAALVPEPSAVLMLLMGFSAMLLRRNRSCPTIARTGV